jgi:tripartite-type tricarboxylate transporter receptor subunit TctC
MKHRLISSLLLSAMMSAQADTWPNGPIKLIVPFTAGGITDNLARSVGDKLSVSLGVPVIYEYKPGNAGVVGANFVAKSKPDGQTLLFASNSTVTSSLTSKIPFDPFVDLVSISLLAMTPLVVVVDSNLPVNNFNDFIRFAQKNPYKINYATSGIGSITHLAMEKAQQEGNFTMTHVPYKGQSDAWKDFLSGRLDVIVDTPAGIEKYLNYKNVKVLAFSCKHRLEYMSNVQTLSESGLPNFTAYGAFLIKAPKGVDNKIVNQLSEKLSAIVNSSDFKSKFGPRGMASVGSTPAEAAVFLKTEHEAWKKVAVEIH